MLSPAPVEPAAAPGVTAPVTSDVGLLAAALASVCPLTGVPVVEVALAVPDPPEVLVPDPESLVPESVEPQPDPASPGAGVAEPAAGSDEALVGTALVAAEDVGGVDPGLPGVPAVAAAPGAAVVAPASPEG